MNDTQYSALASYSIVINASGLRMQIRGPKNDRPFVYVPVGYCRRSKDFAERILSALDLTLPNMVVVTSETTGSIEE